MKTRGRRTQAIPPACCQACGVETLTRRKCGAVICDACKRFFLRHRHAENKLKCDSGTDKCLEQNFKRIAVTWLGVKWRLFCPRCRYNRCLEAGMQPVVVEKTEETITTVTVVDCYPSNGVELSSLEDTLNAVVRAEQIFMTGMFNCWAKKELIIGNDSEIVNKNAVEIWQNGAQCFHDQVLAVKNFVSQLQGYNELPVTDRCLMFTNSYGSITYIGDNVQDEPRCFGGKIRKMELVVNCVLPELSHGISKAKYVWSVLHDWKPTQVELSFLLAFAFYNGDDDRLSRRDLICDQHRKLQSAFQAYCTKMCGSSTAAIATCEKLVQGAATFQRMQVDCLEQFAQLLQRCPELIPVNQRAVEIFGYLQNHPSRRRDTMIT